MLDDIADAVETGVFSVGAGLSFFGLEYINQKFLNGSIPSSLSEETLIFSKEFAYFGFQYLCAFGAVAGGIGTLYKSGVIPLKLVCGEYFQKVRGKNKMDISEG